jgi:spore maturation protein CgeB
MSIKTLAETGVELSLSANEFENLQEMLMQMIVQSSLEKIMIIVHPSILC